MFKRIKGTRLNEGKENETNFKDALVQFGKTCKSLENDMAKGKLIIYLKCLIICMYIYVCVRFHNKL